MSPLCLPNSGKAIDSYDPDWNRWEIKKPIDFSKEDIMSLLNTSCFWLIVTNVKVWIMSLMNIEREEDKYESLLLFSIVCSTQFSFCIASKWFMIGYDFPGSQFVTHLNYRLFSCKMFGVNNSLCYSNV